MALTARNRLKKNSDIADVVKKGKRVPGRFVVLKYLEGEGCFKIAVVVSKKVSKKSVDRNRLKRRMSEIVRTRLRGMKKGFNVVLIAGKEAPGAGDEELAGDIEKVFIKAKLYD